MIFNALFSGFIGAIFGWGLSYFTFSIMERSMERAFQKFFSEPKVLESIIEALSLEEEISLLVDQKLEQLIDTFREKYPMMGLFLTGEIADPLTRTAKEKLMGLVPELKNVFAKKIRDKGVSQRLFLALKKESGALFPRFFFYKVQLFAIAIGFMLPFLSSLLVQGLNP